MIINNCPLISKSSSPLTNLLGIFLKAPITIDFTVIFLFYSLFSSHTRSRYLSLLLFFFFSILWSDSTGKFTSWRQVLFLYWLTIDLVVWSLLCDFFESQNLILLDGFWIANIRLVRIVKFHFFAQFPVDYLSYLVMSHSPYPVCYYYYQCYYYHFLVRFSLQL